MTIKEITLLFKLNGCSISEYTEKGKEQGMIYTRNRAWDINLFPSYKMALDYFIEANWFYTTQL